MINTPPPLTRGYNRDPNLKALERRGYINHGSTLLACFGCRDTGSAIPSSSTSGDLDVGGGPFIHSAHGTVLWRLFVLGIPYRVPLIW